MAEVLVNLAKRLQKVGVEVHINWQTTHTNGEETLFWRVPFETTFTRTDYSNDKYALFTLLNKRLPFAEWSRLEYRRLNKYSFDDWDWQTNKSTRTFDFTGDTLYDYRNNTTEQEVKVELEDFLSFNMLGYATDNDKVSRSTWRFILSQTSHGSAMPTTVEKMRSLCRTLFN